MPLKYNTAEQYNAIRSDYEKISQVKEFGVAKYSNTWIIHKLSKIYYKSPKTIENIIYYRAS